MAVLLMVYDVFGRLRIGGLNGSASRGILMTK